VPAKGRLLVAAPALADPNFHRTVVYILDHDDTGTVGVVLNHPTETSVDDVVPHWGLLSAAPAVIFGGGPVSINGAICLARLAEAEIAVGGVADISAESSGFQLVTSPSSTRMRGSCSTPTTPTSSAPRRRTFGRPCCAAKVAGLQSSPATPSIRR
jgi:Uncharacterized ACR, COG1678